MRGTAWESERQAEKTEERIKKADCIAQSAFVKPLFVSESEADSDIRSERQVRYLLFFEEFVKVVRNVQSADQRRCFAESELYAAGCADTDHCRFKVDREFCIRADCELDGKNVAERNAECGTEIEIKYAPRVE